MKEVSFMIKQGSISALVGPDGAGKTTMLRIMAGLLSFNHGDLVILGNRIGKKYPAVLSEKIGYMPQKFGLYEDLTVMENLNLYADLKGLAKKERKLRYDRLLEMTSLTQFTDRLAGKLSGGMKQKLGLICTLVKPPELLLLDEPTVGVDPLSRRELWDLIKRLIHEEKMTVVISTSYLDEAERCGQVVLFHQGDILTKGSPEEIRKISDGMSYVVKPADDRSIRSFQAELFGIDGIIDAVPEGDHVRIVHDILEESSQNHLDSLLMHQKPVAVASRLEDSFIHLLRVKKLSKRQSRKQALQPPVSPVSGKEGQPIIETRGVYRYFGDFVAVRDVSFSVMPGEIFGLLGPNGAGKTTTFRMLCGLLPATRGELVINGVNVKTAREEARRSIGYVAQKFSLYGSLSVAQNLDFFAGAYGLRGKKKKERVEAVVHDFSLHRVLAYEAASLPGGYKQRLSMAVGLLHQPSILFLDEPTSGADPLARREFWKRISVLAGQGITIVVTTHFMEEAEYCDRILIQSDGVMLAMDTPANIRMDACGTIDVSMENAFIEIIRQGRGHH